MKKKFLSLFLNTTSRFFQFSKNFTICCRKVLQCLCASCFVSCHNCITSDITYLHMLEAKGSPWFKQELAGKSTGPVLSWFWHNSIILANSVANFPFFHESTRSFQDFQRIFARPVRQSLDENLARIFTNQDRPPWTMHLDYITWSCVTRSFSDFLKPQWWTISRSPRKYREKLGKI